MKSFHSFRQDDEMKDEAGGILLGRRIEETFDVIIDRVSEPTSSDRRSRFSFFRSRAPHQQLIDRAWTDTEGAINYLGEWHTHPELFPTPSCIDRRDWRRLLKKCVFEGDELFFVIIGIQEVAVWEGRKGKRKLTKLSHMP